MPEDVDARAVEGLEEVDTVEAGGWVEGIGARDVETVRGADVGALVVTGEVAMGVVVEPEPPLTRISEQLENQKGGKSHCHNTV